MSHQLTSIKQLTSESTTSSDSESDLPYPAPLNRSDFLAPDFSPSSYLSSLHNRHQTLEDLQSELRARSALLSKELLDLVNANYQDFIELGSGLAGSEGKVEEVRLDVMSFRRELVKMRTKVIKDEAHVGDLINERVQIKRDIHLGRQLLDLGQRVEDIERRLMINGSDKKSSEASNGMLPLGESEDEDSNDDEANRTASTVPFARLRKHVQQYLIIQQLVVQIDRSHPFIAAHKSRLVKIRDALLLDLATALKYYKSQSPVNSDRILNYVSLFRDMDEPLEAIKVLRLRLGS